ncbi:MAG: SUMF1/EgtB/PvdO family nonheme iron enzyme [Muribaculaceae bacterium]
MIRNQFILVIVMVMSALGVAAQSLSVESFRALENDLTAINTRTERKDFNGETAALIKVVNPNTGFTFEGGSIGIVHTQQEVAEIWVYVPRGIKKITIKHPTLGMLRDYFFPCAIEAARTYELKLISGQVMTTVVQDIGGQYLSLSVTPANATVYVDEQLRSLDSDGTLSLFLPRGRHTYRVEAASHMADAGAFEISTKKEKFSVVLKSALATLTVSVDDPMASIYVNDQSRGTGSWTGSLEAGMYVVEARRSGYRTVRQSVALSTQEQKTISLTGLIPIYGMLQLSSTPIEASVYIDGKLVGTSPDIFRNIFAGVRELKITKSGYKDIVKQVTIEENKLCQEQVTLEKGADNQTFTVKGVSFNMIAIAGGTFTMGATAEQGSDAEHWEKPAHQVTLSDYSIGETEVTQQLWEAVMGSNPSHFESPTNPVEQVSWDDCQEFIKKLNSLTGAKFALPTEAQWEYAARGGSKSQGYKYSGSNNLSDVAWYDDNSGSKTHPVSTKSPNELGLYDMSGNVWEWCNDWYGSYSDSQQRDPTGATSGSYRVNRGGSWYDSQRYCRVSNRFFNTPSYSCADLGLRLALVQP